MKITYTIEGCPFKDKDDFILHVHANELYAVIWDTREAIRSRLKYPDKRTDSEFLESLYESLHVPGI